MASSTFETIKNIGTTVAVAGAITSGGWWLVKPHAEDFIDQTLKLRGYALQEQVDDANKSLADQERSIQENNRIAVETRDKVILLENKLSEILEAVQAQ
ncbi:MAG: hypothetical protein WBC71_11935 [Salaquimonas sp.]